VYKHCKRSETESKNSSHRTSSGRESAVYAVTRIKHEQILSFSRKTVVYDNIVRSAGAFLSIPRPRNDDEQTATITFGRRHRFDGPVRRAVRRPAISTRRSTWIRSAGRTTRAATIPSSSSSSSSSSSRAVVVRPSSPRSPCPKPVATTSPSPCPTPGRAARTSANLRRRFSDRRRSRTAATRDCCVRSTVFRLFCKGADQKHSLVCVGDVTRLGVEGRWWAQQVFWQK